MRDTPWWVRLAGAAIRRLPRGRARASHLMGQLSAPAPFVTRAPAQAGGFRWVCDLRDEVARQVCYAGSYEPPETALVLAFLEPGQTFVDVGANWGYFTLLAAQCVGPEGQVLSVEPDPRLVQALEQNVLLNELRCVTIRALGADERNGQMRLAAYHESGGNFGTSRLTREARSDGYLVDTRALDELLDEHGIDKVDLMKMDIEGGEASALRGLARSLESHRIRRMLIELHPADLTGQGLSVAAALEPLIQARYQGWRIDHSPAAQRNPGRGPIRLLNHWSAGDPLGPWPHMVWCSPGALPGD